jgi:8-oxo-dGTP pyrophosphatase MutT (NUDIX family)
VELLPYEQYAASLNRKRTSAGVLFRGDGQRVLLVETSYKPSWDIPGGAVEADETPWSTARREVEEELGIRRPVGRLLLIDYVPGDGVMPEGLAFVFDGGTITDQQVEQLDLSDPEIVSVGLCAVDDLHTKVKPILVGRITNGLEVLEQGQVALCESGHRVA